MKRVIWVMWPAFLMAGMIEALVFAFVDPQDLQFVSAMHWSRNATYSIAFLAIWAAVSVSSALTLLLSSPAGDGDAENDKARDAGPAHTV